MSNRPIIQRMNWLLPEGELGGVIESMCGMNEGELGSTGLQVCNERVTEMEGSA